MFERLTGLGKTLTQSMFNFPNHRDSAYLLRYMWISQLGNQCHPGKDFVAKIK